VRIHGSKDQAIERDARRHLSRLVRKDSLKRRDHAGIAGVLASRQRTGEAPQIRNMADQAIAAGHGCRHFTHRRQSRSVN
jgi:hypothetical protein